MAARGAAVEARILDAARQVLFRDGFAALSMEGTAAAAGVAKTTVYRRWRNRADLATAALAAYADPADDPPLPPEPRAAMVEYLRRFRARMLEGGMSVLSSMLVEREEPEVLALHRQRIVAPRLAQAMGLLRAAQDAGQLRSTADLDLALEMMIGSFFAEQIAGRATGEDWPERVVALVWAALAPGRA